MKKYDLSSDEEIIKRVRKGDTQAYAMIVEKYNGRVLGYLYRHMGDYQMAEDMAVETFLLAYSKIEQYKEMGAFKAWLFTIARNRANEELRKRKNVNIVSLDKPIDSAEELTLTDLLTDGKDRPDHTARQKELKEFIFKIIANMEDKYKDVLLLCDAEGISYEEAAKILKMNKMTVGVRLKRARKKLYDELKRYGYDFKT